MSRFVPFVARALIAVFPMAGTVALPVTAGSVSIGGSGSTIAPALAEIGSVSPAGAFVPAGTAFCIGSSAGRSFFVTTHRVAESAPELLAILPSDARRLVPVEIVSESTDPGIAVLAVGVPDVPHVRLNPTPPQSGDPVAIAGYGALASDAPLRRDGSVSAISGGGSYFVQYDARTDAGDDGGPLIDGKTGDVVGIVDVAQSFGGSADSEAVPSLYNNLAISIAEAWPVLAKAPVALDASTSSDFVAHAATHGLTGPAACVSGAALVGRAYGAWARAHGALKSLLAADPASSAADKHASIVSAATAEEDRERAALMDAIPAIRMSGARSSAKLADELATAVSSASENDRAAAASVASTTSAGRSEPRDKSSESALADAAARVSALYDCS